MSAARVSGLVTIVTWSIRLQNDSFSGLLLLLLLLLLHVWSSDRESKGGGELDTGVGAAVTGRDSESGESRFMAARLLVSILASSYLLQSNNF